jgi:hypothetical protein
LRWLEAGRDGFWLARWLEARGVEAHVSSFAGNIDGQRPIGWRQVASSEKIDRSVN